MVAAEGNDYASKMKDPVLKKLAIEQYLAHLEKGKAKRSFVFEHRDYPEMVIISDTVERHLKMQEGGTTLMQRAMNKGFARWEQIAEDSAMGANRHANPTTLNLIMRNKYGWDRRTGEPNVDELPDGSVDTSSELVNNGQEATE